MKIIIRKKFKKKATIKLHNLSIYAQNYVVEGTPKNQASYTLYYYCITISYKWKLYKTKQTKTIYIVTAYSVIESQVLQVWWLGDACKEKFVIFDREVL